MVGRGGKCAPSDNSVGFALETYAGRPGAPPCTIIICSSKAQEDGGGGEQSFLGAIGTLRGCGKGGPGQARAGRARADIVRPGSGGPGGARATSESLPRPLRRVAGASIGSAGPAAGGSGLGPRPFWRILHVSRASRQCTLRAGVCNRRHLDRHDVWLVPRPGPPGSPAALPANTACLPCILAVRPLSRSV